jgi:hypothetical protein
LELAIRSLNCWGEVGSGKLGTPCERMHRANLTASRCPCRSWARVGAPAELDALEPKPAVTVAAAIAAAATRRVELVLNMTQVIAGGRLHECNTPAVGGERRTPRGV